METKSAAPKAMTLEEIQALVTKARTFRAEEWSWSFRADLERYRQFLNGELVEREDLFLDPEDSVSIQRRIDEVRAA